MGIGFSIFLLAAGAILAFAVDLTLAGLDFQIIGWILMAAGVLGLILTMVLFTPRRRRTVAETSVAAPVAPTTPPTIQPPTTQRVVRDETI